MLALTIRLTLHIMGTGSFVGIDHKDTIEVIVLILLIVLVGLVGGGVTESASLTG